MNLDVRVMRSILGLKETPVSAPSSAPAKNEADSVSAEPGTFCRRCGPIVITSIPLRYCPRCGIRFANNPPDPDLEPLEAIEEKIERTPFRHPPGERWSWEWSSIGVAAGVLLGAAYLTWYATPFLGGWKALAVFGWFALLGGLLGSALGVIYGALVRPVLVALFSTTRFEEEYGDDRPAKEPRTS